MMNTPIKKESAAEATQSQTQTQYTAGSRSLQAENDQERLERFREEWSNDPDSM